MIEQKIEKIIIDAISAAFAAANVSGIQVVGAWQPATVDEIKAARDRKARGLLSIKVAPRAHDTFTIAEASFTVSATLDVRAEMDAAGIGYLEVTDVVSGVIYPWQKKFSNYADAFTVAGEFDPTGFRLDGGDCGLDVGNGAWTWRQDFTIQGIIKNGGGTNNVLQS